MAYTPQQQAENMMKGIKNTYQVVAKRHVHPWYSWALMAVAIGFTIGVVYVTRVQDNNISFINSQAATGGNVIKFASDGNEKIAAFFPHIEDAEDDDHEFISTAITVGLWLVGVPSPGMILGSFVGGFTGVVVGADPLLFGVTLGDIVDSQTGSAVDDYILPPDGGAELAETVMDGIDGGSSALGLAGKKAGSKDGLTLISPVDPKVVAEKALGEIDTLAIQRRALFVSYLEERFSKETYQTKAIRTQDFNRIKTDTSNAVQLLRKEGEREIKRLLDDKNQVYAVNAIDAIGRLVKNGIVKLYVANENEKRNDNWRSLDSWLYMKYGSDSSGPNKFKRAVNLIRALGQKSRSMVKIMQAEFARESPDKKISYDRILRKGQVLETKKANFPFTLPNSKWISFRKGFGTPGKGPGEYSIMSAVERVQIPSFPTRASITVLSTDKHIDVRVNNYRVYFKNSDKNSKQKIGSENTVTVDIKPYLGIGENKIMVSTSQSTEKAPFALNYIGEIAY